MKCSYLKVKGARFAHMSLPDVNQFNQELIEKVKILMSKKVIKSLVKQKNYEK